MRFAREGLVFIGIGVAVASVAMAFALYRRSWPLWLAAAALVVLALWIAYAYRGTGRVGTPVTLTPRYPVVNVPRTTRSLARSGLRARPMVQVPVIVGRAPS